MPKFIVCMDSHYVRDCQMVETSDMSDDEFENVDIHDEMMEGHWHDMDPNPFIDVVKAEDQDTIREHYLQFKPERQKGNYYDL